MKVEISKYKNKTIIVLAIIAGLFVRFFCKDVVSGDMKYCLLVWYDKLKPIPLKDALVTQIGNYNLLYQLIIYIMTKLPGNPMYQYKMLSVLFDFVLAGSVYLWLAELKGKNVAVFGFAITFMLPTVWMNSAAWGQCDSIYTAFVVLALFFLYKGKYGRSFILLGLGFAFKLQTIFILPFYGCYWLTGKKRQNNALKYVIFMFLYFLLIPLTMIITAIPNLITGRPITDLFLIYLKQTNVYQRSTLNYPGLWGLTTPDYSHMSKWAIAVTFLILIALFYWFYKAKIEINGRHFMWCAFITVYTCVIFLPAMHERYSFLYEILAVILVLSINRGFLQLAALQMISIKTYYYYLFSLQESLLFLSIINMIIYTSVLYGFYLELKGELKPCVVFERRDGDKIREKSPFLVKRAELCQMALLMFGFLVIGSFQLGSTSVPRSFDKYGAKQSNGKEVVFDVPDTSKISVVKIYLGNLDNRTINVFASDGVKWNKCSDVLNLQSVFAWNEAKVDAVTKRIDIIFSDDEAVVGEVAIFDEKGNLVTPYNAGNYPALFDEQKLCTYNPTYFDQTMFDEVYHGRTAYEFLHKLPIYENTHPPLGKILIAIGVAVFGMVPFGYRIICLIFGSFMIPVVYLFALRLTGKREYGLLAGILMCTEFMHYTLARIATIDIIVAFFVLCMFYGVYAFIQDEKYRYLLFAGLSSAFGVATKWTALYALFGLAIILFIWMYLKFREVGFVKENRKQWFVFVGTCLGAFIVLPAIVYVLSYIPFAIVYPEKNILEHAISNSIHMLDYHSAAKKEHPFSSRWYSWPLNWVPLLDARSSVGTKTSAIVTFNNPLVSVVGLLALIHHFWLAVCRKDKDARFMLIAYFVMYAPWFFISRTTFIYQYFIPSQLLILMICYSMFSLNFVKEKKIIKMTAAVTTALFVMFFPVISGLAVNRVYIEAFLEWLPRWKY